MNSFPLISIITVVYNDIENIEQTILSIINQTYCRLEYIVIDGGSTDGTIEVIRQYSDKISYWVSEPDKGIYDAMNKGIVKASGEWINFMNAGDTFASLSIISDLFFRNYDSDVIYGDSIYNYEGGSFDVIAKKCSWFSKGMIFCHQSSFIKTELMKTYLFDLRYKYAADYNLFWTLFQLGKKFEYIQKNIAVYSLEGGATDTNYINCFREVGMINGSRNSFFFKMKIVWLYFRKTLLTIISQKSLFRIRKYIYTIKYL